jgi:LuxR family transcriptional regulator, activator of tox operons
MDVHFLDELACAGSLDQLLCDVIDALGTPRFEESMLSLAERAIRCTHLSAFSISNSRSPRLLVAANGAKSPSARRIASKYIRDYWSLDPVNRFIAAEPRVRHGATLRMLPQEVEDALYQRDCYLSASLIDRVSIVKCQADEIIRLNFYRNKAQGRFADVDLHIISQISSILLQTLSKHDKIRPALNSEDRHRQYCGRLASVAPQLTEREIQVCVEIVRGLSSEAIASSLGLSVNTILTHRRRAYSKLGISSQSELSHMLLQ